MAASYAEAASSENKSKNDDYKIGNVKSIFLLEADVFGDNAVNYKGQRLFLTNTEVYKAINEQVPVRALIGLQRVRGVWRIYFDNEYDKKDLLERSRIDNLLTNCRTGDRIVICVASASANTCSNGWKCRKCGQLGHKQYECNEHSDGEYDEDDTYMINMDDVGNQDVPNESENDEHNKDCTDNSDKSFQESEVYSQRRTKPLVNTEDKSRSDSDTEHSQLILGTQERRSYGKDSS
ncbi:unnamed protein product [Mytilus coruscus]|uniref:CCHC-type domain-containing protein n=1 Tax=Mytilus coruscus TaxID=42192 RepID=A0A6J8DM49_MYTCO|nr:unnamed protein product [Mytilus coruscus]